MSEIDFARVKEIKASKHEIVLNPDFWRACTLPTSLQWKQYKFRKVNQKRIPATRGIYVFVVRHDNPSFPPHGYIWYVGIAGKSGSKNTLRDRYGNYFNDRRPRVQYMVKQFRNDLVFFYAQVTDESISVEEIEKALNDAIVPPASKNDFSGEMRRDREAAF
jgi:hypothetical protein